MGHREEIDELTEAINALDIDLPYEADVYAVYAWNLTLYPSDFEDWKDEAEEAYAGEFGSDEEFAENLAEELGMVPSDAAWPNNYIDWERAARDLMMDYFEQDGLYFRNM